MKQTNKQNKRWLRWRFLVPPSHLVQEKVHPGYNSRKTPQVVRKGGRCMWCRSSLQTQAEVLFCVGEIWERVSVLWQQGNLPVMCDLLHVQEPSFDRGPRSIKATLPPAIMLNVITTRSWPVPQWMVWHKPYGITHPAQQQADSELEQFSIGLLTPDIDASQSICLSTQQLLCIPPEHTPQCSVQPCSK